ncbi:DUF4167 domain-containing protein [Roseibium aestuarii]|uniref:DUF4167 domain-containing protein n=1 Tax=Roseibium aestuarii TaxID=2600299 RepID=A0ABW4JXG9_9HYPH|nr:DUF4167 domain-containing protein [Roseibium aestuarii]
MRPGNQSNKRMRGRGRKGPNPLTRTYESNGPDVKIRGTALHVAEKYQQLARDAQASGDRIMSENYFQHAEHYLRIVASAQQGQPMMSSRGDDDQDEGDDDIQMAPSRPERAERPDRAERPERAERSERFDRGERQERRERPSRDRDRDRDNRGPSIDPDSPQPFIDAMPIIDDAGHLNGHDAGGADMHGDDEDAKPRRRVRGTRGRGVRRDGDAGEAPAQDAAPSVTEEEAAPKPKRRTTRRKAADQDAEPVPAGE